MSALVLMSLLMVGAKPAKPAVSLPMPPPPAAATQKPAPPPEPAPAPAASEEKRAPPPSERALLDKIQLSAAVGPGFSLQNQQVPNGGSPVWLRGVARATLDLARVGPGDLQALAPIAVQGAGFRTTLFGLLIEGSLFSIEVMPSVRYVAEVMKDLSLFAELGLGFAFYQVAIAQPFVGYQYGNAGGFGLRVGGGIEYKLLEQLRLLVQPMELTSFNLSSTTTQNGTTVTTTTGAAEWSIAVGAVVPL